MKYIKFLTLLLIPAFFIGCGQPKEPYVPHYTVKDTFDKDKTLTINSVDFPPFDEDASFQDKLSRAKSMFAMTLRGASKETLDRGFTHFLLVNNEKQGKRDVPRSTLRGFPLNTFETLFEYCGVQGLYEDGRGKDFYFKPCQFTQWRILPLNNPPYSLFAFDAKKILAEVGTENPAPIPRD